jgi:hypothetical protein
MRKGRLMGGDDDPHNKTASGREITEENLCDCGAGAAAAPSDRVSVEAIRSSLRNEVNRSKVDRTRVPIWIQNQPSRPPPPPPHEGNALRQRAVILLIACGIAIPLLYYFSTILLSPGHQLEVAAGSTEAQDGLRVNRAEPESAQQSTLAPKPVVAPSTPPSSPPATPAKGMSLVPAEPRSISTTTTTNLQDVKLLADRGRQFFEAGDLIAARIMLLRAVIAGDAEAAVALGATYDPIVLADRSDLGIVADLDKARSWYERAKEMGSPEGPRRLEMLARR